MKKLLVVLAVFMLAFSVGAQNKIERETLVYSVKDTLELKLVKFVDNSVAYQGKRPVMIYVHGGGFMVGSRVNALQDKYCKHFAEKGFVSFAISYRLGIKNGQQANQGMVLNAVNIAVEDLFDATAFILKNADKWNIDKDKIMISGGSAGAVTCLTAEYDICSAGKYASKVPQGFNFAGVVSHAGCVVVTQDTLAWKKTPCPILLMHGDKDVQVPFDSWDLEGNIYAGSNYIHKQLITMDAPHWFYIEEGADHIVALKPLQYNFGEIDNFIDRLVLKGEHATVKTGWKDKVPGSMEKMFEIVPLYMTGWEKTDEEVEQGK
jgi:poly(3-hydroxybutyrate) depolymerase